MEACILKIINYELSEKLRKLRLDSVNEGTIYPILLRLQQNNFIYSERRESEYGTKRKYCFITDEGKAALELLIDE